MSDSPATETPFELDITALAHGGDGLGRLADGRVVFVPRTAPGDRIRGEVVSAGKRELHGRLRELIAPGPGRVAAACPHYDACGGCQWQHLDQATQLQAKQDTLRETLARVGRVPREEIPPVEVIPSPQPLRYRRRARFHLGENGRLGYVGNDGRSVVEIDSCQLLTPALETLALDLSAALQVTALRTKLRTVELCEAEGRGAASFELDPAAGETGQAVAALVASVKGLSGAVIDQQGGRREVGEVMLRDGAGFLRPDTFAQANRAANDRLVTRTLELLAPESGDRALELYCGDGNFTVPLSKRVKEVLAADREGKALAILRDRMAREGLSNVSLVTEEAERLLPRLRAEGQRFEVALLDPPRTGAKALMDALAAVVTRRIVYVSCDPATLSRDLGQLRPHGFRLAALAMVDLFPQTYHLEAIAMLDRRAA